MVLARARRVTSGHPVQFSTADPAEMAARFAWHYDKVQPRRELPGELAVWIMSDGLVPEPIGSFGDSAHFAFGLISVQRIAELHVNIAVPNP